ncbi:hypothetical protein PGIN_13-1_01700 [Porphyromonas gingivalis]|nr:hypothetical protein PGIN_13-1_01700 [Porphyromonas gingivalis]
MSYDTFLLYLHIFSEYVQRSQILPKYSQMATIWLHFFEPIENCSQEYVESSFRARIHCCYSKYYVELFSMVTEVWFSRFWLQFIVTVATILLFLATTLKTDVYEVYF